MRQKDSLGNRQEVAKDECNESIFYIFQLIFVLLLLFVIQNFYIVGLEFSSIMIFM